MEGQDSVPPSQRRKPLEDPSREGMMEVVFEGLLPPPVSRSPLKNKVTREGNREGREEGKEGESESQEGMKGGRQGREGREEGRTF